MCTESEFVCDWCDCSPGDGDKVACQECVEALEEQVKDLTNEVDSQKDEIESLNGKVEELINQITRGGVMQKDQTWFITEDTELTDEFWHRFYAGCALANLKIADTQTGEGHIEHNISHALAHADAMMTALAAREQTTKDGQ